MTFSEEELREIAGRFDIQAPIVSIKPLGNGLINDTFKITTDPATPATAGTTGSPAKSPDYVLQRINNAVFTNVELLQDNIEAVTAHIRKKLEDAGEDDIDRKVLTFIKTKEGNTTWTNFNGTFWRVSIFISDAFTYETVNPEYSRIAGLSFGKFEADLTDLDKPLGETIPDFHNIELRVRQLKDAAASDTAGRLSDPEVRAILDELLANAGQMCKGERLHREGKLPKRICHCDTKVNNMLFDADGNVLCVIDLDTVMPSFVFSDYGDFLRTAANFVAEDDPAVEKVGFNMDIFKAFTEGYLEGAASFLTPVEKENLPYAACLFPYMQAVRFFADYLNGDTYYKIKYPQHNLVRTRNQVALWHAAREKMPEMAAFIAVNGR